MTKNIKRTIFLVINSQLFLLYNFSKFLYIFTLFIHPSTLNITNKTPHSHDDGSAEPKRYSVDWLCFSISLERQSDSSESWSDILERQEF